MPFNVVLVHPEIPQNTGNIGRLCVNTDTCLHLVKPLGFKLNDKYMRRAGLDYWEHLELQVYGSTDEFFNLSANGNHYFFSTKGKKLFWDCPFEEESFLIFGNETSGFPPDVYSRYNEQLYTIPMPGKFARSLNLSSAVAIVLFEGIRRRYGFQHTG